MAEKFDPSTWDDDLLDRVMLSVAQTSGRSLPNDQERQAVMDEYRIRGRNGSKLPPHLKGRARPQSNVDANLEASASPIAMEPETKAAAPKKPAARDIRQAQIDRLVAAGDDPQSAARHVDYLRNLHGSEMDPALFDSYNTPAGNAALAGRIAKGKDSDARMSAFEADYNASTGHPDWTYTEAGMPVEAEAMASSADTLSDGRVWNGRGYSMPWGPQASVPAPSKPLGYTAPGPRTLDGKAPAPRRPLRTQEEVEAYSVRPENQLSQQDADMKQRGMVPVVTPDGVGYMVSAETGGRFPGGPGRAGDGRPDLVAKGWVPEERLGPDGRKVLVYVPGPEMREKQARDLASRQDAYKTKKAANDADRAEAKRMWRATAMLAGGSHNINSGNRAMYNQLAMLNPEDQQRALLYMSPGGSAAAAVDARNADQAGRMAQSAMTAFLTNNPGATEQQRAAADMQNRNAESQQSAAIQAEAESLVNASADDQGWLNLPTRLLGGGVDGWDNTLLTVEEEEAAVRKLRAKYPHLTYEQALGHVEAAAAGKTRQPRRAAGE